MIRKLALAFALLVLALSPALAGSPALDTARTFVFAASIVKWPAAAGLDAFTDERKDGALMQAFGVAGVASENITFLTDDHATLAAVRRELRAVAKRADEGSTLVLSFQGHGDRHGGQTYYMPYDVGEDLAATAFAFSEVAPILDECFRGDRLILLGDFCHSGALADVVAHFEKSRVKAACFTSATASNRSTDHWTFTEAFIDALRGDGRLDRDHDGTITFAETDRWIHEVMKYREGQLTHASRTTSFEADLALHTVTKPVADVPGAIKIGDFVDARDVNEKWCLAEVLGYADAKYRVHFVGWDKKWDEDVAAERLRAATSTQLEVGGRYEVEWDDDQWYPGTATRVEEGWFFFIHYEGEDGDDDEWITESRARKPTPPEFVAFEARAPKKDDVVAARWRKQWFLAKVTAVEDKSVRVLHEDGTTARVTKQELIVVAKEPEIAVGQRVLACWNGKAEMFPGTVVEKGSGSCKIKWQDGSEPSDVAFDKVVRIKP